MLFGGPGVPHPVSELTLQVSPLGARTVNTMSQVVPPASVAVMVDVDGLVLAVNVVLVASAGSTVPPPDASQWTVLAGLVEIVTFSPIPNVVLALFAGVVACVWDTRVTTVTVASVLHSAVGVVPRISKTIGPGGAVGSMFTVTVRL